MVRADHGRLVAAEVVLLADELVVVQHVELLAGGELLPAHQAGEAVEVEHFFFGLPHQVAGRDALAAAAALRAISPETKQWNRVRKVDPAGVFFKSTNMLAKGNAEKVFSKNNHKILQSIKFF